MKNEWTMTDDEWEESLAREAEEAEEQVLHKSAKQIKRECEQIQEEIEKQYGYV